MQANAGDVNDSLIESARLSDVVHFLINAFSLRLYAISQLPQLIYQDWMQIIDFKFGSVYKVLVASYEALRNHAADLAGSCGLLVCDEGHRLKASGGSKTMAALVSLGCQRCVLLTGTPLQNNLEEFYGKSQSLTAATMLCSF